MRTVKKMVIFLGDSLTNHRDLHTYVPFSGSYPRRVADLLHLRDKNILVWQLGYGGHGMARNNPRVVWSSENWLYTVAVNAHVFKVFAKTYLNAYKAKFGDDIILAPDVKIFTVHLHGTIDVGDWDITEEYFKKDYIKQVPRFDEGPVFTCLIPPQLWDDRANYLIDTEVNPTICEVAKATGAHIINYNTVTQSKSCFHTGDVHLNEAGNKRIGDACYAKIKSFIFGAGDPVPIEPIEPTPPDKKTQIVEILEDIRDRAREIQGLL
jgi:hypothetical protein